MDITNGTPTSTPTASTATASTATINVVLRDRARASGLSMWELGDLLGIHPHQITRPGQQLDHLPCAVIIDLARRLDMHPADLVAELDPVLTNPRTPNPSAHTYPMATDPMAMTTGATGATGTDQSPATTPASTTPATTLPGDVGVVLAALAHALEPLTPDELATALDWALRRVVAAIKHANHNPHLGGPLRLRRPTPGTYTVTARLDQLTTTQRQRLGEVHRSLHPLDTELAETLLAVLALQPTPADYLAYRANHYEAEDELKRDGLIHADHGPHRPQAHTDVLYSLRYWSTPESH